MSMLNLTSPPPPSVPAGTMCAQHKDVEAATRCRVCGSGICSICDFTLPGDLHVCPACIEGHDHQQISPARIRRAWLAIALAGLATIFLVLVFSGAIMRMFDLNPESEVAATIIGNLLLWPSLAGIITALTSYDRRLGNNGVIWTAVIWNAVLFSLFILMMIIGLMAG